MKEMKMKCPFRKRPSGMDADCVKQCALYVEEKLYTENGEIYKGYEGCSFKVMAEVQCEEKLGV